MIKNHISNVFHNIFPRLTGPSADNGDYKNQPYFHFGITLGDQIM